MTVTQDSKSRGFSMTRWRVSDRGHVAHVRLGTQFLTLCGEVITKTAKPVKPSPMNPPCVKCGQVLQSVSKKT